MSPKMIGAMMIRCVALVLFVFAAMDAIRLIYMMSTIWFSLVGRGVDLGSSWSELFKGMTQWSFVYLPCAGKIVAGVWLWFRCRSIGEWLLAGLKDDEPSQ